MIVKSSKLSDFKIKKLVWCFCVDVEASKVSLMIRLNRNTVNRLYHLFRTIIYYHQLQEFKRAISGEAEKDEAYFGAKRLKGVPGKRGRGTHKQPVFGIYERNGRVYTEIVQNCNKKTLQAIIRGTVDTETIVHADK